MFPRLRVANLLEYNSFYASPVIFVLKFILFKTIVYLCLGNGMKAEHPLSAKGARCERIPALLVLI